MNADPQPEQLDPVKDATVNRDLMDDLEKAGIRRGDTFTIQHATCHCCGKKDTVGQAFAPLVPSIPPCECAAHPHCHWCHKCGQHCKDDHPFGKKEAWLLNHDRPVQNMQERGMTIGNEKIRVVQQIMRDWLDALCDDNQVITVAEVGMKEEVFEAMLELVYGEAIFTFIEEIEDL